MDQESGKSSLEFGLKISYEIILLLWVTLLTLGEKLWRIFFPRPLKSLEGEIILITGSGNGIGREIALELANSKATLVCWDNESDGNNRTVADLKAMGTKAAGYTVDISSKESVKQFAEKVQQEVGDVSIIINNAGIAPNGPFMEMKEELLEKVFEVNLFSHFWILRQFLPKMIERNHGHVITIASLSSFLPTKEIAAYTASKHAVTGFIDSLRQEIAEHPLKPDIKFTTAYPCFVQTRLLAGINIIPKYDLMNLILFTPEYVAKRVVQGFRQNYEHLYIPSTAVVLTSFVLCLPYRIIAQLHAGILATTVTRSTPISQERIKKSK